MLARKFGLVAKASGDVPYEEGCTTIPVQFFDAAQKLSGEELMAFFAIYAKLHRGRETESTICFDEVASRCTLDAAEVRRAVEGLVRKGVLHKVGDALVFRIEFNTEKWSTES